MHLKIYQHKASRYRLTQVFLSLTIPQCKLPPNPHISRLFSVLVIDEDLLRGFWASLQSVGYGSTQQLLAKPDSSITIYFLSRRIYNTEPVIMTSITGPSISLQQNTYTHMLKG